jgi:hypothetical protein
VARSSSIQMLSKATSGASPQKDVARYAHLALIRLLVCSTENEFG